MQQPGGKLVFTTRETHSGSESFRKLGPAWNRVLERNGFDLVEAQERKGVSDLWQAVYNQWVENELALRGELPSEIVYQLLAEVNEVALNLEIKEHGF